jgi:surfactin synthase thioesterase subunit
VSRSGTWAQVTEAGHETVVLPGGHFFPREQEARLLRDIASRLTPHAGAE